MKRRSFFKSMIVGIAAMFGVTLGGLTFIGCDSKTVISWAGTAVAFLEMTLQEFNVLIPGSTGVLTKAIAVAKELQAALKAGSVNAVDLIQQLLAPDGLIQQIVDTLGLIQDDRRRQIVAGLLLIARAALVTISTAIEQGAGSAPPQVLERARAQHKAGVAVVESIAKSNKLEAALKALKN